MKRKSNLSTIQGRWEDRTKGRHEEIKEMVKQEKERGRDQEIKDR